MLHPESKDAAGSSGPLSTGVEIIAHTRKDVRLYTLAEDTLPHVGTRRLYGGELQALSLTVAMAL